MEADSHDISSLSKRASASRSMLRTVGLGLSLMGNEGEAVYGLPLAAWLQLEQIMGVVFDRVVQTRGSLHLPGWAFVPCPVSRSGLPNKALHADCWTLCAWFPLWGCRHKRQRVNGRQIGIASSDDAANPRKSVPADEQGSGPGSPWEGSESRGRGEPRAGRPESGSLLEIKASLSRPKCIAATRTPSHAHSVQ
jgi:hypothetical protein